MGNTACFDNSCSDDYGKETYAGSGNYAGKSCSSDCLSPKGFSNGSSDIPIGIALDGNVVYGPYNKSGEPIAGLDSCNGKYVDGNYAYFSTATFPCTFAQAPSPSFRVSLSSVVKSTLLPSTQT